MNERIQELANQMFSMEQFEYAEEFLNDEFMEKFAELIVWECVRMCDVAAVGYETHGHTKEANGCYSAKEYIEEHFGVDTMSTEDKKTLIKELLGVKND